MLAIATLLLIVAISLAITRIATVILTATGMSRQAARFQARSAFTGSGFTTSESERVVNHPVCRRVIATLMLLGNIGIVSAASTTILGFRHGAVGREWWRILELVAGLLALVFVSRSRWIDRRLTAMTRRLLSRHTDLPTRDVAGLLDLSGSYAVAELAVNAADWLANRSLGALELRDEGVVVLGLTRADGRYLGAPTGATVVRPKDVLIAYGRGEVLHELDGRLAGPDGERAHRESVARQMTVEAEQDAADRHRDAAA